MAESPDPTNKDFLSGGIPYHASKSVALQTRNELANKKQVVFARCIQTCWMEKDDVYSMLRMLKNIRPPPLSSKDLSQGGRL